MCHSTFASEADWFDVDAGYQLRASYGRYDDGAESAGLAFVAPLPFASDLGLSYRSLEAGSDSEDSYFIRLHSDTDARFSFGASLEGVDANEAYESIELQLQATLSSGPWETQVRVSRADVQLDPVGIDDPVLVQRVEALGLLDATRDGIGASLAYFHSWWGLRLSVDDYELERDQDLESLDRETVLAGLSADQRRELLAHVAAYGDARPILSLYRSVLLANHSYNQHATIMADYTVALDAYFWDSRANSYAIGLQYLDQIAEQDDRLQAYISADFSLGAQVLLGLLVSAEDGGGAYYTAFSFGYGW